MQNVFSRDMFSMGPFDGGVKCNGHVQLPGRTTKKDRKGCKKEKIETVLKNRLITSPKSKTPLLKSSKMNLKTKNQVIRQIISESEENMSLDPTDLVNKPNLKEDLKIFKEFVYSNNTSPTPPPIDVPEQVEDRLSTVTEVTPKKITAKKRNKNKPEKNGLGLNKNPDKIDPSCVNDKNQLSCNVITIPPKRKYAKLTNWQKDCGTRHETLQRILKEFEKEAKLREDLYSFDLLSSDEDNDNPFNLELEDAPYQRFWLPSDRIEPTDRDAKVNNLRSVLRRRFHQLSNLPDNSPSPDLVLAMTDAARHDSVFINNLVCPETTSKPKPKRSDGIVMVQQKCCLEICHNPAIPCTRHCFRHILRNVDQLLFEHCSARTNQGRCTNAVFNVCNVQPLCFEHLYSKETVIQAEEVPATKSKSRKRPKNSPFNKLSKRNKKKKQSPKSPLEPVSYTASIEPNTIEPITCTNELPQNINCDVTSLYSSVANPDIYLHSVGDNIINNEVEVGDEVLAGLDTVDLGSHASRLLEDHDDITSVFSQIPVDAFNDLFTIDKNGQYVPSREETEELERALEAVDMDVRSLERLSQSHMANILDPASLLADLPIPPFSSS